MAPSPPITHRCRIIVLAAHGALIASSRTHYHAYTSSALRKSGPPSDPSGLHCRIRTSPVNSGDGIGTKTSASTSANLSTKTYKTTNQTTSNHHTGNFSLSGIYNINRVVRRIHQSSKTGSGASHTTTNLVRKCADHQRSVPTTKPTTKLRTKTPLQLATSRRGRTSYTPGQYVLRVHWPSNSSTSTKQRSPLPNHRIPPIIHGQDDRTDGQVDGDERDTAISTVRISG